MQAKAAEQEDQHTEARRSDKLARKKDTANFAAMKATLVEENLRDLGTVVSDAEAAAAAVAARRCICKHKVWRMVR